VSNTASRRSGSIKRIRKNKEKKRKKSKKKDRGVRCDGWRWEKRRERIRRRDQKIKKRRIGLRLGPIRQLRGHWTTPNLFLSTQQAVYH